MLQEGALLYPCLSQLIIIKVYLFAYKMSFKPVEAMAGSRFGLVSRLGNYMQYLLQYRNMYRTMVKREFQGKFKNTALGYFWHLLNPLSQILIYLLIFTVIFGRNIPNYWVYVSTGMFAFTFFSNCVRTGCNTVIRNSNLVTKMTFAREILVLVNVTSGLITLSISYVILSILMIVAGVQITWYILYVPVIVFFLTTFTAGLSYLLAALTVYIRDLSNAVGIILTCLMFAVPIFYVASSFQDSILQYVWAYNPLYHYIECIHSAFYSGVMPDVVSLLVCIVVAPIMFIIGLWVFKKMEPGFAERL